ncbi:MAG: 2-iminoacetate synthase ThiH [Oligoflexia bacterium]|nr:2-iminoacetate synthase ThiH [Oligoflexia bacterium]
MFSNTIQNISFQSLSSCIAGLNPTEAQVTGITNRAQKLERMGTEELMLMLSPGAWQYRDIIQKAAKAVTLQRHGKTIRFYAPLYVSSHCINRCAYCGFNACNAIERRVLTIDEILREAHVIKSMGIEHLLLVAGESKTHAGVNYLKDAATALDGMFSSISIEVAPLSSDEYSYLFKSGIEGVACYQETYNPELYLKYHVAGPKRDIKNRLDTMDRAGTAGMRFLGIGSLLGLADFRAEAFFIAMHAHYIEKKYWRSQVQVSFPRLRPSKGNFIPEYNVTDDDLLQMISVLRLFLPDSVLVLSTRESAEFRNNAIHYGINQISAGSKTMIMGYSGDDTSQEGQFSIADHRSPSEIAEMLSGNDYDPVFKDWDRGFRQSPNSGF